jgi:hypothetical protein
LASGPPPRYPCRYPLIPMQSYEELPSGKQIIRQFDADGRVTSESHSYGTLDIGIRIEFNAGLKTGEMYFLKKRLISRKRYDKARAEYADMPPPDSGLEDFGAELLKDVQAERRQHAKASKEHVPDPNAAAQTDAFCRSMLETGKSADARTWIESTKHTLGEYPHSKSRKIVDKLIRLGAKRLHVCDIDCYDNDQENTGHLVVEFPDHPDTRKLVFREVDRLASLQGFQGEFDNDQRYAYVKLD